MLNTLKDISTFVGFAAFIGFAVLLYLYIARARELRRIRDSAPFLTDGGANNGQPSEPPSRTAAERARRGNS